MQTFRRQPIRGIGDGFGLDIHHGHPRACLGQTAGWVSYSFTTTVGGDVTGGLSLQFVAIGGAGNLTAYVDNVSIVLN